MTANTQTTVDSKTRILLFCGVLAYPVFLVVVLIQGIFRADYSAVRYPLSSLAIGHHGWIQTTNFLFTGMLMLSFSVGLSRTSKSKENKFRGPLFLFLVAIGLIGAGIFRTDPVYGYPPEMPLMLAQFTLQGHMHDAFSILVFVFLPCTCFIFRKRFLANGNKILANYSTFSGLSMILFFVFTSLGFKQIGGLVDYAGLFQRACIGFGGIWVTLLSLHLLRNNPEKMWR